jgi:hypothetical protein
VSAKDPKRSQRITCTGKLAKELAKVAAARMGPTVWEDEGPIPIVKRSKTEKADEEAFIGKDSDQALNRAVDRITPFLRFEKISSGYLEFFK